MALSNEQKMRSRMSQFIPLYYLATYPDVKKSPTYGKNGRTAFKHYVRHGINEKRRPNPWFDPRFYQKAAPSSSRIKRMNGGELLSHWSTFGILEGRPGTPYFQIRYYLNHHTGLLNKFGAKNYSRAFSHWMRHGNPEARVTAPGNKILRFFGPKKGTKFHILAAEGKKNDPGMDEKLGPHNTTGGQVGFAVGVAVYLIATGDPSFAGAAQAGLLGSFVGHGIDRGIVQAQKTTGPMWHSLEQGYSGELLEHWKKIASKPPQIRINIPFNLAL